MTTAEKLKYLKVAFSENSFVLDGDFRIKTNLCVLSPFDMARLAVLHIVVECVDGFFEFLDSDIPC